MKKRVLIPLAPGFEELEAIAAIDLLRRAGAHVVTASVDAPNPIAGKNRVRVMADIDLPEALDEWGDAWDLVVLPGGPGVVGLAANERLVALLADRIRAQRPVAAICAAPTVLALAGLPTDTPITSWPGSRPDLAAFSDWRDEAVVATPTVVTGRGPGTSVPFALALVALLYGAEAARALSADIAS
jgi:4-methyl-5(b-hydroxyethyl)-thiazole monophosphate biosynthesis